MITASLFIFSYMLCRVFLPVVKGIILEANLVLRNYQGKSIPTSMGLVLCFSVIPILGGMILLIPEFHMYLITFMFAIVSITLIGLIDDFLGKKDKTKGFKGHFKNMLNGRITTGSLKACFGVLVAFLTAIYIRKTIDFELLVDTAIISLMTNLLNLFDLRPGRACKVFVLFAFIIILVNIKSPATYILIPMMGAVAAYLPFDLRGIVMMGDTGSNVLGVVLGSAVVVSLNMISKIFIVFMLVSANILSEKISFSEIISKNRVLKYLDSLGRKPI